MLPPGPRLPGVLQIVEFAYRPLEFFERCRRRFGDPFTLRFPGFGNFVMVSSPPLIKQVFTGDPDALLAGKANTIIEPLVGRNSMLLLDGKEHLRQRRLMMPPLHGERMQAYATLMAQISDDAVARMPDGRRFALHPFMQDITLQVILRAVFGLDEGAEMDALKTLLIELMEPVPPLLMFLSPRYLRLIDVPLSPYRRFRNKRACVVGELRRIIAARRAVADSGRTDILSLLITARDEDGRLMSDEELVDELLTMLAAGHETTATALSWTFGFLLSHPDVAARLQEELDGALDGDGNPVPAALAANGWLDAVVKESLRLRPIIPDVVRELQQPMTFAGWELPAGTFVAPCIHLAHRRAESWPEPDRFNPERFIGAKIDPYAWLPFGGGIRRCLGMAFALYEMKIVLGVVLSRARLSLATATPLRIARRGVTLAPAGGMPVVLEERLRARRPIAA